MKIQFPYGKSHLEYDFDEVKVLTSSIEEYDPGKSETQLVAEAMADRVRALLEADIGVSVTGLAGPDGDDRGNPVGTVFVGYADESVCISDW